MECVVDMLYFMRHLDRTTYVSEISTTTATPSNHASDVVSYDDLPNPCGHCRALCNTRSTITVFPVTRYVTI